MTSIARFGTDASVQVRNAEEIRQLRTAPIEGRVRTFIIGGFTIPAATYVPPLFIDSSIIVDPNDPNATITGVITHLRVGTATVTMHMHDGGTATAEFDVTTTRAVQAMGTPEDMLMSEPVWLTIDAVGGDAMDLAFGVIFE